MWKPVEPQVFDRRLFLRQTAALSGGLILSFYLPPMARGQAISAAAKMPSPNLDFSTAAIANAFIEIKKDDRIVFTIHKLEMGQGVVASLSQLLAEELECAWAKVEVVFASVAPVYNATFMPTQMAGGSSSISSSWDQLRRVGALARELLIGAAAQKWGVDRKDCRAEQGFVLHEKKGRLRYGELVDLAKQQPIPSAWQLKAHKDFHTIGKSMPRPDAALKVSGKAIYGLDLKLPEMLYAVVARPPFGAKLKSWQQEKVKALDPKLQVISLPQGSLAFVGKDSWIVQKAKKLAEVQWQLSEAPELSQAGIQEQTAKALQKPGKKVAEKGKKPAKPASQIEAQFEFPYLAHACMEPLNCTIDFRGQSAEIWSAHQMPTVDRAAAAQVLGIAPEQIKVNTVYAGGSFGRRASKTSDYVVEAASLAKILQKPVKVFWTREDDMQGGFYRPYTMHKVQLGFDSKNQLKSWQHQIAGQGVMVGSFFGAEIEKSGIDPTSIEGVADTPYDLPYFHAELSLSKNPVTTLWWRAVGHTHTAYVMETMMDIWAEKAKMDPLTLRRQHLKGQARHLSVLDLLEQKSDWQKPLAAGRARGLALHQSFQSVVAHVVELSLEQGKLKIHRITSAVHCGTLVNPEGARAQVESAIVYGLSAALYGQITLQKGQVEQSNFHDYPILRFADMPSIAVHFVPSEEAPTGLGEPGLPPLAPALANALSSLTKKRYYKLPLLAQIEKPT